MVISLAAARTRKRFRLSMSHLTVVVSSPFILFVTRLRELLAQRSRSR